MLLKRFFQFVNEKKGKIEDIQQAEPLSPAIDPSVVLKCPKCGETGSVCKCYTDDYYNAKLPQQAPRPNKKIKPKNEKN
jgi:hypothetical protein